MGNVARPQEVRDGKKAASQIVAALLLQRHPSKSSKCEAAQDLQDLYHVPERDVSSGLGDYWLKLVRGEKVLGDETLSRVAHAAVLRGHITPRDYPFLSMSAGGLRLLQVVGSLLIETHAGTSPDEQWVEESLRAWQQALADSEARRAKERKLLRARLKSAKSQVALALQSVDELVRAMEASEHFEAQYHPDEHAADTYGETPYASPAAHCASVLESLQVSLAAASEGLARSSVQEKFTAGFADLPSTEPRSPDVTASLAFMHKQVLDMIGVEWGDDYEDGEIVVEDLGDCLEPLPICSDVKQLVWIRRANAPRSGDSLKSC